MGRLTIGVDPGQRIDPTAIVVAEEVLPPSGGSRWVIPRGRDVVHGDDVVLVCPRHAVTYEVRHMERLLHEPYPEVARRVAEVTLNVRRMRPKERLAVVLDITGLGRPVYDMVSERLKRSGVRLTGATFTYGQKLLGAIGDEEVTLGKAYLVSRLQTLFQQRRIRLPEGHAEAKAMLRELTDYEIKVRADDGHEQFGAFSVGAHDDLVTALGLACLGAYRNRSMTTF